MYPFAMASTDSTKRSAPRRRAHHWPAIVFGALLLLGSGAQAQTDVGVVTRLSGAATVTVQGKAIPATPFMKLRAGDRIAVPDRGELAVVYFADGRTESWKGPAAFTANVSGASDSSGQVVTGQLSKGAPPALELRRIPEIGTARPGSVTVRSFGPPPPPSADAARGQYAQWRAATDPKDPTPDIYLLAVLAAQADRAPFAAHLDDVKRRFPALPEAAAIEKAMAAAEARQ
ncbi:MAG: hypothetical protein JNM79_24345 [Burkholderiales bacterium]|nr:hypothetical protein [Burkholderiales bacterium]